MSFCPAFLCSLGSVFVCPLINTLALWLPVLPYQMLNTNHGEVVDNVLRAEHISLHDPMLLHGSEPNASARRRMGLTLRYAPYNVSAESWMVWIGILKARWWQG